MMFESTRKRTTAIEDEPESSAKKSRQQYDDEWDVGDENQETKPSIDRRKAVEDNPKMIVHFQHSTKSEREKKRIERQKRVEEELKKIKTEKEDEG
jgi:hypothetical protein